MRSEEFSVSVGDLGLLCSESNKFGRVTIDSQTVAVIADHVRAVGNMVHGIDQRVRLDIYGPQERSFYENTQEVTDEDCRRLVRLLVDSLTTGR